MSGATGDTPVKKKWIAPTEWALREAINFACRIIEEADARLLADDGPCGNQPPRMTLAEWRTLYVVLDRARAEKAEGAPPTADDLALPRYLQIAKTVRFLAEHPLQIGETAVGRLLAIAGEVDAASRPEQRPACPKCDDFPMVVFGMLWACIRCGHSERNDVLRSPMPKRSTSDA